MKTIQEYLNQLKSNKVVSRGGAIEIDKLVKGTLTNAVHINSFTELPSSVNIEVTILHLERALHDSKITLDMKDMKEIVSVIRKNKVRLEKIFKSPIKASKYLTFISDDTIIDNKPLYGLSISEFIKNKDKVFNVLDVDELPLFKVLAIAEIEAENADSIFINHCVNKTIITETIQNMDNVITSIENAMIKAPTISFYPKTDLYHNINRYKSELYIEMTGYFSALLK